ncbi:anthrone oxygenase family protein [Thalassotalea ganghwensis]
MGIFEVTLVLSGLLCALVAGLLFIYAIVIMPGIRNLDDKQFIKVFQVTDKIIQDNHPLFLFVWVGSALSLIVCAITSSSVLQGIDFYLLLLSTGVYLAGVQALTVIINLPLNNRLQTLDINAMTETELSQERLHFEPRWNRANRIRAILACGVSLVLISLALRF